MGATFPNESPAYRAARNQLLQREVALRREMEAVASEIRALPPGGAVPEDYEFDHIDATGARTVVHADRAGARSTGMSGTVEPMWTLLDLTPGGRPDANEQIEYECCRTEVPADTQQP